MSKVGRSYKKATELPSRTNSEVSSSDIIAVSDIESGNDYKVTISEARRIINATNEVLIKSVDDFPTPIAGIITLEDDTAYLIDGDVDLGTNRIVCGDNNAIHGFSPEISVLHGTYTSQAMITANQSLSCYRIAFYVEGTGAKIINLDASTSPDANNAIDWQLVNFIGGDIGTIKDYSNCVFSTVGTIDRTDEGFPALGSGFIFDGTIGSVVFTDSLLTASGSSVKAIEFLSTLTLSRRFRATDSVFLSVSGGIAIETDGATIQDEGFILVDCNFSGDGTYLANIDYTDDRARFEGCRGITNTYAASEMYFATQNATATVIGATGTPVKIAGTTTAASINSKFDHAANRLTYTGALDRAFLVTATASASSGNNNQIGFYVAVNGTVVDRSETYITANSSGRLENVTFKTIVSLSTDDYIETFVENNTATNNVTVEYMNITVTEI